MNTNIGLSDKQRQSVAKMLDTILADEFLLYVKTRGFHWNVVGPDFGELHTFFEQQYEALDEIVDEVAERARALDAPAAGSMRAFMQAATLEEVKEDRLDARAMLLALLNDHESLIREIRTDVDAADELGDAGTTDFLTGLMERHEKTAWMLRSYLR